MKHETYSCYTLLTNGALSNAIALECMFEAYIDHDKEDVIEPAFSLVHEQLTVVRKLQDLSDGTLTPEVMLLSARTAGVSLMVSALLNSAGDDDKPPHSVELPEAILTMIKACILNIKSIRCAITNF